VFPRSFAALCPRRDARRTHRCSAGITGAGKPRCGTSPTDPQVVVLPPTLAERLSERCIHGPARREQRYEPGIARAQLTQRKSPPAPPFGGTARASPLEEAAYSVFGCFFAFFFAVFSGGGGAGAGGGGVAGSSAAGAAAGSAGAGAGVAAGSAAGLGAGAASGVGATVGGGDSLCPQPSASARGTRSARVSFFIGMSFCC
jgi:hypothetical protein